MAESTTDASGALSLAADGDDRGGEDAFLEEDLLVEDVSIDGMCGVY